MVVTTSSIIDCINNALASGHLFTGLLHSILQMEMKHILMEMKHIRV
jgi:hypothetical protein